MKFEIATPDELEKVSNYILENFPNGTVILLKGNLGAGKSTFVKNFVKIKAPQTASSSPTFSILHEYGNDIFHYDLYRIGSDEFINRGLAETVEKKGWHFIEWADEKIEKLLSSWGIEWVTISITQENEKRVFDVKT